MKVSNAFKNIINVHLQGVADRDPLFAESFKKPNKNLDDCITYILNTVQKSGCNGFADEEIFGMAMHYYDEDDVQPGKPVNARVVVNHQVEPIKPKNYEDDTWKLPENPTKEQVRLHGLNAVDRQPKTNKKDKPAPTAISQPSLFD